MNANPKVLTALSGLKIPVAWLEYKGSANEYIVFNDAFNGAVFYADDMDIYDEEIIQVHYYTTKDPIDNIRKIKKALRNEGFSILETLTTRDEIRNELLHTVIRISISDLSD